MRNCNRWWTWQRHFALRSALSGFSSWKFPNFTARANASFFWEKRYVTNYWNDCIQCQWAIQYIQGEGARLVPHLWVDVSVVRGCLWRLRGHLRLIGIKLKQNAVRIYGGNTFSKPSIYFSGFPEHLDAWHYIHPCHQNYSTNDNSSLPRSHAFYTAPLLECRYTPCTKTDDPFFAKALLHVQFAANVDQALMSNDIQYRGSVLFVIPIAIGNITYCASSSCLV